MAARRGQALGCPYTSCAGSAAGCTCAARRGVWSCGYVSALCVRTKLPPQALVNKCALITEEGSVSTAHYSHYWLDIHDVLGAVHVTTAEPRSRQLLTAPQHPGRAQSQNGQCRHLDAQGQWVQLEAGHVLFGPGLSFPHAGERPC